MTVLKTPEVSVYIVINCAILYGSVLDERN